MGLQERDDGPGDRAQGAVEGGDRRTGRRPAKRPRMSSRRAWKSVQLEVEVSSRYRPWVGIHASQSNLRWADSPRSPAATSMTR